MKKIHIHGIVGLFLAIALIFSLNATAGLHIDPNAAAVSQSIGYIMSEQYAAAQSNSRAFCSPNIRKKLAGSVQDGFYLSSVTLTDHNMSGSQGLATGMFVHQDAYQRRVYHQFSLFFQKSDTIEITDVSVEPIFNLKPITKLFIVKADRVSMADLESASFAKALEIASLNASPSFRVGVKILHKYSIFHFSIACYGTTFVHSFLNRLTWVKTYSQGRINFLLSWLRPGTFSYMHYFTISTVHGNSDSILAAQLLPQT